MRILVCFIISIVPLLSAFAALESEDNSFLTFQDAMSIVSYHRGHPMNNDDELDAYIKKVINKYSYKDESFLEGVGTCDLWQYIMHGHTVNGVEPLDDDFFVPDDLSLASTIAVIDCNGIETIENDETAISVEMRVFTEKRRDEMMKQILDMGFTYNKTDYYGKVYLWKSYTISIYEGKSRGYKYWEFRVGLNECDYGSTKHYEFADSSSTHNLKIQVDYPVKGSSVLLRRIRTFMMEVLELDLQNDWPMSRYNGDVSDGQALVNDYGRRGCVLLKEKYDSETLPFDEQTTIKKVGENNYYISFEVVKNGWYGGATSGPTQHYGVTFRKSDGKRIRVIKNPQSPQFKDFLSNQMYIEDQNVRYEENKNNVPFPQYEPFLIQSGVRFIYQKYEIAPVICVGDAQFSSIRLFLSDEVKDVLKQ